ncbi:MAG: YfiR family protein [Myxococcota bacterium]
MLLALPASWAWASEVPPQYQAVLFLKALAYDQNLKARAPKTVNVVVLHRPGAPDSEAASTALIAAMIAAGKQSGVGGTPLQVTALPFTNAAALESSLVSLGAHALFLCPGLTDAVPAITAVARRRGVLSGGGSEAYARAGVSIGLGLKDQKAVLFVNLAASRAEGAKLDSSLLRVAQVIN